MGDRSPIRRTRRRASKLPLLAAGLAVALCSGCSAFGPVSIAERSFGGQLPGDAVTTPPPTDPAPDALPVDGPTAGWLDDGARFAVLLGGSSSCAPVPVDMIVVDGVIELVLERTGGAVCSADMAFVTHVFATPTEIDPARGADIRITSKEFPESDDREPDAVLPPLR